MPIRGEGAAPANSMPPGELIGISYLSDVGSTQGKNAPVYQAGQEDAETRFVVRATRGNGQEAIGLALLDKALG